MKNLFLAFTLVFSSATFAGWNPFEDSSSQKAEPGVTSPDVAEAVRNFKASDSSMKTFFAKAYGYAVFPTVAKGGFGIGGAYGEGELFEQGKKVGTTSLTQVTIGFQLGGQAYSEIIFFKDKAAIDDFKGGNFELGAQASAVAATAGASADADYDNGVAIFTLVKGGLMYEASVGGQKFTYEPN